jgi:hypothetical protein
MKIAVIVGWILVGIEGLFVLYMFVQPNIGDDAAGRGMARGFAFVLGPILLLAAALFIWGQRGGPRSAFWAGFAILAIPLAVIVKNRVVGTFNRLDLAAGKALYGKFDDRRLTNLARAIEAEDLEKVRAIIAEGPIDFAARSRRGRTILGRAIEYATTHDASPKALESVRLLFDAGAKPLPNVIEPEFYRGDLDAHLLVAYVFGGNSPNTVPLLDMTLGAGGDANTRNYEGQPLYFSTYATRAKLEVLAKHGADFTALETTRTDRAGYTGAMSMAELGNWEIVGFLLEHGVRADYVAPDSNSLRKIIAVKKKEGASDSAMTAVVQKFGLK